MYVVSVIPIAKSAPRGELSYFSRTAFDAGSVISVPLRGKHVPALVTGSTLASKEKASLRRGTFALRAVRTKQSARVLSTAYIAAAEKVARQYISPLGTVLYALLPTTLLADLYKEPTAKEPAASETVSSKAQTRAYRTAIEAPSAERIETYLTVIRTSFARNKSVYLVAPTIEETEYLFHILKHGIEHRSFCLTTKEKKATLKTRWHNAASSQEPVLICATPAFLSVPRNDLGVIIVERESARPYTLPGRPYLQIKHIVHALADETGAQTIFGDVVLSVETRFAITEGTCEALGELAPLLRTKGKVNFIDVRRKPDEPKKQFTVISAELLETIHTARQAGAHTFLLATRRGYAPTVLCNDCGTRVSCTQCESPIHLKTKHKKRIFSCPFCGAERSALEACVSCGGWNLIELGIGVERVYEEIGKAFDKKEVFLLERTTAPDHARATAIRDAWQKTPGGILVGTELAVPYLHESKLFAGIVSLDSLLSIPEWKAHERAFSLIAQLRDKAKHTTVQTRRSDEPILQNAQAGNTAEMVARELALRKQFNYPPFKTIVLLALSGKKERVTKELESLAKLFENWHPQTYDKSASRGELRGWMALHLEQKELEENQLLRERLSALPLYIAVHSNPESMWE